MSFDVLQEKIIAKKNPTVAGLDPKPEQIPPHILKAAYAEKGETLAGAAEALRQVVLLREVLATIVEADGRSLEAEPEQDAGTEEAPGAEEGAEAEEPSTEAEEPSADAATTGAVRADEEPAVAASAPSATVEVELPGAEPAPETLEQPATPSTEEVVDAWSGGAESAPAAAEDAPPATADPAVPEDPRR